MKAALIRIIKRIFSLFGIGIFRFDISKERVIPEYLDLDLMLDVGANTGQYVTLIRRQGFKNQIVSFEPLSAEHLQLQANSRKDVNWEIFERCAIGNVNGSGTMNISQNSFSSSLLGILKSHLSAAPESAYIGTESTPIFRLSEIYQSKYTGYKRLGLKIDVQGFEMEVLLGAQEILNLVSFVQIEMSLIPVYSDQKMYFEIDAFLRQSGFSLWKVVPGFSNPVDGQQLQFDGIYVK